MLSLFAKTICGKRHLPEEYLQTLSADVQAEIRRRIAGTQETLRAEKPRNGHNGPG